MGAEITYDIHPSVLPFHNSRRKVKALCGPLGSGKSSAAVLEFFMLCKESSVPIRGLVVRATYPQLKDATKPTYERWLGHCSTWLESDKVMKMRLPSAKDPTKILEHELHFRHALRAADASKFLSAEYGLIWLEEVVPAFDQQRGVIGQGIPEEVFLALVGRLRQAGIRDHMHVIVTFNPPSRYHWAYKHFFKPSAKELEERNYAVFQQPPKENAKNLPPDYYEDLEKVLGKELSRRFIGGEVVTMFPGRRVFEECSESLHMCDELPIIKDLPLVLGFDFGLTPVALISQITRGGQVRVLRELQLWGVGAEKLGIELKQLLKDEFPNHGGLRCWGDPAGSSRSPTDEKTCFDVLAVHGFAIRPGAIAFAARKEAVKQRFCRMVDGEPAIRINRTGCPMLAEGLLGGYRYLTTNDGLTSPKPHKNDYSHVADALQYICTGEFSVFTGEQKQESKEAVKQYNPLESRPAVVTGTSWMSAT